MGDESTRAANGRRRAAAISVIVGSIGFGPIGLVAVVGARRVLDGLTNEQFQQRRTAIRASSER